MIYKKYTDAMRYAKHFFSKTYNRMNLGRNKGYDLPTKLFGTRYLSGNINSLSGGSLEDERMKLYGVHIGQKNMYDVSIGGKISYANTIQYTVVGKERDNSLPRSQTGSFTLPGGTVIETPFVFRPIDTTDKRPALSSSAVSYEAPVINKFGGELLLRGSASHEGVWTGTEKIHVFSGGVESLYTRENLSLTSGIGYKLNTINPYVRLTLSNDGKTFQLVADAEARLANKDVSEMVNYIQGSVQVSWKPFGAESNFSVSGGARYDSNMGSSAEISAKYNLNVNRSEKNLVKKSSKL